MAERSVVIALKGNIADFQAKMKQAQASVAATAAQMGEAGKQGDKMRRSFGEVADVAGKIGLGAAAGLAFATKAAIDWESAWAGVTKTVDGTASEMAVLEEELRALTGILPASHAEIAAVAEAAGQLGVERESIAAFTQTMIDLGETTNLTADEAATAIAQMGNVMQTAPEDIDNLGSALVALGNDGASTERDIILMAQRIAGAGALIGLAESDILAIANAASSMGIEVEAGGTAVSRVFTDMAKAVAQGGEDLEMFAETAGVSSEEFVSAFTEDPAQAFALFTTGLNEINQAGGDVFTTLESLQLADVRVQNALLGMAASGDLLTDSLELGSQAWDDNTALALEAAKRYETTAAQMQIAWNQIKDAAIDFGEVVLPVLAGAAESVAGFANAVGNLPGPVKTAGASLAGITAVLGGGLWFTSKAVNGVVGMRTAMTDLGISSDKANKAMKGVGAAAAGLAVLATAAAGVRALQEATDESLPGMEALTSNLLRLASGEAGANLGQEFDSLGESLRRLADPSFEEAMTDILQTPFEGLFGEAGSLRRARAEIDALDAAFAGLVTSGGPEMARDAFSALAESQGLTGFELSELFDVMPQFREALIGVGNEAKLTGDATSDFGSATAGAASDIEAETQALLDNIEAMEEKRDLALSAIDAEYAYAESLRAADERMEERRDLEREIGDVQREGAQERSRLQRDLANADTASERQNIQDRIADSLAQQEERVRDLRERLEDYRLTLDKSTDAGQANWQILRDQARAWNDLSPATQNAEGAFEAAKRELFRTARQFGATKKEAREFVRELLEIPQRKLVEVDADTEAAHKALDLLGLKLGRMLRNRSVRIDVTQRFSDAGYETAGGLRQYADGGYTGGGGKYQPAGVVHAGEYVINAEQTRRHFGLLERLNRGYADGGFVAATRPAPSGGADMAAIAAAFAGRAAPVIGHQTVLARDLDDWRRQTDETLQLTAMGGADFR